MQKKNYSGFKLSSFVKKLALLCILGCLFVPAATAATWSELHEKLLFLEKTPANFDCRPVDFVKIPADEQLKPYKPEKLTFDFDDYVDERCPEFMQTMLSWRPAPKIYLVAGFTDDTVSYLKKNGVKRFGYLEEKHPVKIKTMKYLIVPTAESFDLYITNFYGVDWMKNYAYRLVGMAIKHGLSADNVNILYDQNYKAKSRAVIAESLKEIQLEPKLEQWVMIGYQGAFFYFLRDLIHYFDTHDFASFLDLNFAEFRKWNNLAKKQAGKYMPERSLEGDENCSYFKYRVKFGNKDCEIYSFRNMFGDQSQMLIDVLLEKGFRKFAIFGNAGGLSSRVKIAGLYAPVSQVFEGFYANGPNKALKWYQPVRGVKVSSLFEEDNKWLEKHREKYDFVDVEQYDVFRAFADYDDATFYSAILISDIPGRENKDITDREESSREMIKAKEDFYFRVIKDLLEN
jgi:hypothetical protein